MIRNRYGEKVVTWSSNTDSNMKATDAGIRRAAPRSLGKDEINNMRKLGGMRSAHEMFGKDEDPDRMVEPGNPVRDAFADWVKRLGKMAGKEVSPVFIHEKSRHHGLLHHEHRQPPKMQLNTLHLDEELPPGPGSETAGTRHPRAGGTRTRAER